MTLIGKALVEKYKIICQETRSDPHDVILEQLNSLTQSNRIFNLTANSFCVKSCKSLGKFLADDSHFDELRLSDCLLQEEALKVLLEAIVNNTSLTVLNLKGNNIRADGSACLGVFLKYNHGLKSLILDWNNIGMLPEGLSSFCEGLAVNDTLQELILRNNQISHVGAAEIGSALRKNTTLKILDLRWNNIGLLGGRALAECLQSNRSLLQLELNGNNVPVDCLNSIARALKYNVEHQTAFEQLKSKEEFLRLGLRRTKETAIDQVNDLNLQDVLNEILSALKTLESKFDVTQNSLTFNLQRNKELEEELRSSRQEIADLKQQHFETAERERVLLLEIRVLREQDQKINLQITNSDEQLQSCKQQIAEKRDEIVKIGETLNQREIGFKRELAEIQQHHRELTQEYERKQRELEQQLHAMQITFVESKEKLKSLESQKSSQEDEIAQLKSRRKIEKEETEERAKLTQLARDEMQRTISSQVSSIKDLQNKLENCRSETENPKFPSGIRVSNSTLSQQQCRLVAALLGQIKRYPQRKCTKNKAGSYSFRPGNVKMFNGHTLHIGQITMGDYVINCQDNGKVNVDCGRVGSDNVTNNYCKKKECGQFQGAKIDSASTSNGKVSRVTQNLTKRRCQKRPLHASETPDVGESSTKMARMSDTSTKHVATSIPNTVTENSRSFDSLERREDETIPRVTDMHYWNSKLKESCDMVDTEIQHLLIATDAADKALDGKTVLQEINKCYLVLRDQNTISELVQDSVKKESRIIDSMMKTMNKTCNEAVDLICGLCDVKSELESNFQSKEVSETVYCEQYYLTEDAMNISLKPPESGVKESLRKEDWIKISEGIIKSAECQVKTSREMCDYIYAAILKAEDAVQNQKQKTDSEFYRRTHEFGQAIEELQRQKKNMEEELCRLEMNLTDAQKGKNKKWKLVESRLESRIQNQKKDKIDVKLEKSWTEQRKQLPELNQTLEESIIDTTGKINGLRSTMKVIDDNLKEKLQAQQLDQDCMEERKRSENEPTENNSLN